MAIYTVKVNQNIFDIALHLYGSIEGIFDLLITNHWLGMTTDLKPGQQLEYHEGFVINKNIVDGFMEENIIPANGIRPVKQEVPPKPNTLAAIIEVPGNAKSVQFRVAGSGEFIIDWDDNSDLETVTLGSSLQLVEHYLDDRMGNLRIKIYGKPCVDPDCHDSQIYNHMEFKFTTFDASNLIGNAMWLKPIVVDEYICENNAVELTPLFLFRDTTWVSLRNSKVDNLLPLASLTYLNHLDLEGVQFSSVDVLDDYLEALLASDRSACTVLMTTEPSGRGYEAIRNILSDPEWNTPNQWHFYINETEYTL